MNNPESIPKRFAEGWNERNVDKLASVFDEDADFVNVVGIWWRNRADIRRAHDYGLRVIFKDSNLRITKTRTKMLTEDVAVVHARMQLDNQTALDNSTPQRRFTLFSFVVHRNGDGEWSCASAHNTDIVSGKETHIMGEDGNIEAADYRKS
ncbi:MAG: SgcJ/EcaC family oxidoreductase [Balneolia bacterium]|nr:SgcJ/EcaC family oxidoreductase [Balneolia bacterium]